MPITDKYILQPSPPFTLNGNEDESVNLALQAAPNATVGVVQGSVRLANGTPVPSATVQLFTSQSVPVQHVSTNPQGLFVIPNVPVGAYLITAAETGFLTPPRIPLSVTQGQPTQVTITLQVDPAATTGAVFGIVRNATNNQPVNNAAINLFRVDGATNTLIGTVASNSTGQYLFANLPSATYFVQATVLGYLSNQSAPVTITGNQFAPLDINLTVDPNANTGTLSGIITDQATGSPVSGALVALYALNGGVETIVQITQTNAAGLYLFGDLQPGTYRVKATAQIEV